MNKINYLALFLALILLNSCSVVDPIGVWKSTEKEIKRAEELEKEQKKILNTKIISSNDNIFSKEKNLATKIILSKPLRNSSWKMSSLNHQNLLGNIYLSGIDNIFLREKVGKNKFSATNLINSPLIYKNNLFFTDNNGTIFKTNQLGKVIWKKNIYQKLYKKIYKNLSLAIYENNIYIADNIGFIYSINLTSGEINWIKNHAIPIKSKIKIFKDKIFLINQDNRIFSLSIKDGTKIWDIRSLASFIKLENPLSLSISKQGHLVSIDSSGTLIKADTIDGSIFWTTNIAESNLLNTTDFFKASEVIIHNNKVFISTNSFITSLDLFNGSSLWNTKIISSGTPIIDGQNMFVVTKNGFFVIININNGQIISSKNILTLLKKRKRFTEISGFIMGSGKIYSLTSNGFIIVASALTGKPEFFKKIGGSTSSSPIISDGNFYVRTRKSKILGIN